MPGVLDCTITSNVSILDHRCQNPCLLFASIVRRQWSPKSKRAPEASHALS